MRKHIFTFILFFSTFLLISCSSENKNQVQTERPSINVMAYYVPEKDYQPENLPLNQLTHIIYSFTNVIDGEMKFRDSVNESRLMALVAERNNYPGLKVMVACGGWGAKGFSDMASTEENRKKFVESVVAFNKKYDLDGLDMDWEYPGIPAAKTKARKEDKENFTALMKALREGLDGLERPQVLTFASAGWKFYYTNVELKEVMKYADYMNVMTYDQIGGSSPFTGHHTALGWIKESDLEKTPAYEALLKRKEFAKKRGGTYEPRSVENIIDFCIKEGVKPEQLVVGAAFYGRAWKGVPPQNYGLYQSNKGVHIGWSAYHQIRNEFEKNKNFIRHWDPVAKAPYLYSPIDSIFISYDDTVSVSLKTEYAIKNRLGGIMFWELGNDTKEKTSLLNAIYSTSIK